jgi:tRNA dimethylallyltransferase
VSAGVRRVAVVGPTASGKSSVAMAVAGQLGDVDLLSIDSMQVYRGMDIGTAKPSAAERAAVPHHLIDLVEPSDEFAVAEFQRAYRLVLDDLSTRSRRGILVGGTGLYHRAAIDDLDLPGEWPDVRARLEAEASELGPEALHERLTTIDPAAAARMEPTNARRIVRALEVCEGSGRPFSSFGPGLDTYPPSRFVQIGLQWDRAALARRIEARVHAMLAAGLLAETEALLAAGPVSRTARQALGYRELIAHLEGATSYEEAVEAIVVRTRQFAVRQDRWFRRDPRIRWIPIMSDPVAEALPALLEALHR